MSQKSLNLQTKSPVHLGGQRGLDSSNPNQHKENQPMNMLALSTSVAQMMSSREISELTGKEHKNVLRDIRSMLDQLDGSILSHG